MRVAAIVECLLPVLCNSFLLLASWDGSGLSTWDARWAAVEIKCVKFAFVATNNLKPFKLFLFTCFKR